MESIVSKIHVFFEMDQNSEGFSYQQIYSQLFKEK